MTTDATLPREAPLDGTETDTLLGSLERQRRIFAWKCSGVDAAGMRQRLGPSTMTLGGLVKHVALVEDAHVRRLLLGEDVGPPWDAVDFDADPDWEWRTAADDTPEELLTLWSAAVVRSRALVAEALSHGDLGQPGRHVTRTGGSPSLRRILIDLIEEYARHVGHADLLREAVDGWVGEEPPARARPGGR